MNNSCPNRLLAKITEILSSLRTCVRIEAITMTKYPLSTHNTTTHLTFGLTNKCWRHSCCVEYDHSRWCKKSSHCFHVILNEWCTALRWELGKRRRQAHGIFKTGVLYRINFRLVSGKQGQMIQRHRAESKMRTTSTPCHARICVALLIRTWQICTSLNMMVQKKMMTDYWSYRNQPRRMTPS